MGLRIDILTLFPEMFDGFCSTSIVGRAVERGLVALHLTNIGGQMIAHMAAGQAWC